MPPKEVCPGTKSGATTNQTTTDNHHEADGSFQSTAVASDFDFDKTIVSAVDKELWAALFDGHFRLAVPCDICGRWLTDGRSKRAHRGPRCAAKAVTK